MLPFLKPKQASNTIIVESGKERKEDQQPSELMAISEQLISAIHSKDAKAVADCLSNLMEDGDGSEE